VGLVDFHWFANWLRVQVSHGTRLIRRNELTVYSRLRSVKWVGLFGATALVGLYTIEDLWNKFGDLKMPKVREPGRRVIR